MGRWPGRREISDLTYKDELNMFTRYLMGAGYLDENVWEDSDPEYLIEVKTTTGGLGDRFYMSSNQYRMVSKRFHLYYSGPLLILEDAKYGIGGRAGF
jgi:hypothetical protein